MIIQLSTALPKGELREREIKLSGLPHLVSIGR